jgi:hypothetical protein
MKKIIYGLSLAFAMTIASGELSQLHAQTTKSKTTSSRKGKYALVGAGAGAATGAVVSHKRGKGALIGGAAGAAGGYLLGRHKDKKHPQVKTVTKSKA